MTRELRRFLLGITISILLITGLNYFGLWPYFNRHFRSILILTGIIAIGGFIWAFRRRRKMLDRMPKSTIEYLDHDGEN